MYLANFTSSVLENVLPPNQYQMQYGFKDGVIVDAVVVLDKGKILPIDSKFSLENYNRMVNAADKAQRDALLAKVKADLKGRIEKLPNTSVRARVRWILRSCSSRASRSTTTC